MFEELGGGVIALTPEGHKHFAKYSRSELEALVALARGSRHTEPSDELAEAMGALLELRVRGCSYET